MTMNFSNDHRFFFRRQLASSLQWRYAALTRLLVFLLLWSTLPLSAQQPFFLKNLSLKFNPPVEFPEKAFQKQYRNRPYSPTLRSEIRSKVLEELKNNGYYFASIDSGAVGMDSLHHAVNIYLSVRTGGILKLDTVSFNIKSESLPGELKREIAGQAESYLGHPYTGALARSLFRDIINVFENSGYPLAKVSTGEFAFREKENHEWLLQLQLDVIPGDSVQISYLRFPKQKSNLSGYIQRLLRFKPGQEYQERKVARYPRILRRQEFIKQAGEPLLAKDKDGQYFLSFDIQEAPSTTLDGIIGYIPPPSNQPDESGYFTGLVNIGVRNLFGGGRKILVFWQREDRFSEQFKLAYKEPFTFGAPFHTQIGLDRLVRDTTYIEWQYHLNFEIPFSDVLSAYLGVSSRSVSPDSLASRQQRLPRTESLTTRSGIQWDTRNERFNPRRGIELEVGFSLSRQDNKGPRYLLVEDSLAASVSLTRFLADLSIFIPTFKQQLIANHAHLEILENSGGELLKTDQVWFGGATTVRGFRESQFFAKRVLWLNTEYRFILGPQARFFVFTDNAYYTRNSPDQVEDWLTSYGLGLRFAGPLGIIQTDIGLEKGAPLREAKIHFRIINEF